MLICTFLSVFVGVLCPPSVNLGELFILSLVSGAVLGSLFPNFCLTSELMLRNMRLMVVQSDFILDQAENLEGYGTCWI